MDTNSLVNERSKICDEGVGNNRLPNMYNNVINKLLWGVGGPDAWTGCKYGKY